MTRTCPKCNQTNPPDASFCLNCSSPLGPTVGGAAYQQQSPPHAGGQAPYVGAPPQQYGGQNFGVQGGSSAGGTGQKAVAALILAIVGLLCCGPFTGIPAAIVGWLELDAIKNGKSPAAGKWMAQVGLWGGIAVSIIHSIFAVLYMAFAMMASTNPYGY